MLILTRVHAETQVTSDPNLVGGQEDNFSIRPDQSLRCSQFVPETQDPDLDQLSRVAEERVRQRQSESRGTR